MPYLRQIYPSLPKNFMIKYTEATNRSNRYLFIDLKQKTPSRKKIKDIYSRACQLTNIFSPSMVGSRMDEYINRETQEVNQFEDEPQSEQTYLRDFEKDHRNIEEKMPSCDDCGLMFE